MDTSTDSMPANAPTPETMVASTGKMRIGFGKRLWAGFIDAIITFVVGALVGTLLGASLGSFFGSMAAIGGLGAGVVAGVWLAQLLNTLLEATRGASLGKMILKIQIADQSGVKAKASQLWLRWLAKNIAMICMIIAGILGVKFISTIGNILGLVIIIGCFFVLGKKRQAFHDMLAKTVVYHKKDIAL